MSVCPQTDVKAKTLLYISKGRALGRITRGTVTDGLGWSLSPYRRQSSKKPVKSAGEQIRGMLPSARE